MIIQECMKCGDLMYNVCDIVGHYVTNLKCKSCGGTKFKVRKEKDLLDYEKKIMKKEIYEQISN